MFAVIFLLVIASVWGQENDIVDFVAPFSQVKFSTERGFFTAPFNLTLTAPKELGANTTIRYVLRSSTLGFADILNAVSDDTFAPPLALKLCIGELAANCPSPVVQGTLYSGPLLISHTCYIHAIAYNATGASNLTVHTFIFPADVVNTLYQPYVASETAAKMITGLTSIPTVSAMSAYGYPLAQGNWNPNERPGNVEWLDPLNPDSNWVAHMDYEYFGGYSRYYAKKNFRIHFRSRDSGGEDGEGKVKFRVFGGVEEGVPATRVVKVLDMRAHSQDGIFGVIWFPNGITYMKNIFADWTMLAVNDMLAVHARYVHFYYNGYYMGMNHLRERLGQHFFREYLGGTSDDWEGINSGRDTGQDGGRLSHTYAMIVNSNSFAVMDQYIDWKSWFAFSFFEHYSSNSDLSTHNWQCGGQIHTKPWMESKGRNYGGWKFFPSDDDFTFLGGWNDQTNNVMAGGTFVSLTNEKHPEFVHLFGDFIWQYLDKPGALLADDQVLARFQKIYSLFSLDSVVPVELGRWAGYCGFQCYCLPCGDSRDLTPAAWRSYVQLMYTYIPGRNAALRANYAGRGFVNPIGPPIFSIANNAKVLAGTSLTITPLNTLSGATVYYTINGQDPRIAGGAVNPNATSSANQASIKLTQSTLVTARFYVNGAWGVIDTVYIAVVTSGTVAKPDCALCGNIIFTEVNYHAGSGRNSSEFVEVKNIGNTSITMTGAIISRGVRTDEFGLTNYTFPAGLVLKPGQFYVVAFYYEDFKFAYLPFIPDDIALIRLDTSGGGDDLALYDQFDNPVHTFCFETKKPWSKFADGNNYTLVAKPEFYSTISKIISDKPADHFQFWRYSVNQMGSPWNDDPPVPASRIIPLTFSYVSFEKDWVQLSNPTNADIDISLWLIQNKWDFKKNNQADHQYEIPAGTVIRAKSILKVKSDIKFSRKDPLVIFEFSAKWQWYTGNYIQFDVQDNELAFKRSIQD